MPPKKIHLSGIWPLRRRNRNVFFSIHWGRNDLFTISLRLSYVDYTGVRSALTALERPTAVNAIGMTINHSRLICVYLVSWICRERERTTTTRKRRSTNVPQTVDRINPFPWAPSHILDANRARQTKKKKTAIFFFLCSDGGGGIVIFDKRSEDPGAATFAVL